LLEREGVEYEGIPCPVPERFNRWGLYYQRSLLISRAVRRFNPDLLHAFGYETGAATIALRSRYPVSCFIQGISEKLFPYYKERSWIDKHVALWCERKAVSQVRWMVAENEFARNWALRHNPSAQVQVIPHALRSEFLEGGSPNFAPNFVCLGTITNNKGVDTCVQALAKIHHPDATLTIIGNGPYQEEIEKLSSRLGVAHRVHFLGPLHTSDVIRELNKSTCLLLASRMDTSPNVITEAHAIGIPVIGTRVGGIPEMIVHEVDGFLVDGNDATTMASYMNDILDDPQKAQRMGAMGRKKVQILNDPARIAAANRNFFSEVLAETAKNLH
jgi:glycosyltransferase involved in cell wall biosynthesis